MRVAKRSSLGIRPDCLTFAANVSLLSRKHPRCSIGWSTRPLHGCPSGLFSFRFTLNEEVQRVVASTLTVATYAIAVCTTP
jgi:replicative DNA helicase